MAITFVAGLASVGSAMIAAGGLISIGAAFGAFAIGAGLSLVSRALAPSPDLGAQMAGQSVMTRDAAHSRKIVYGRARIGGNVVYLESTGTDNKYLWLVTAIAGHEIDAYEQVWFNDQKVWENGNFTSAWATQGDSSTSPYINLSFHLGNQTTADSGLNAASTKWTDNHKLLGTAYMVVKLTYDQEKFAQGLPNISTVIRGKKVLDPETSTTAWSQNPALCIYDYLRDTKYGLGETASNILTSSVNTAKDVCNQTINLSAGGTQARYTMDGVIDTGNSIKANIENMTGAMIGRLVYSGGKFELHAGQYVAPTVTIDESMIIGEISVQTKQSRRNAYNGVKGVFLSETDNYILADYPAQISSTYAAQDGDPIYLDMPLPYTVNNIRAQRLAKLALQRSRQQEAITIPCNLNALKFKIGDNISVTNTRLGYSGKVFEVVGYSMGFSSDQMVVNVEAIETAASIWDWATSDEEVFLGAGEVDIYDGTTTTAPTNLQIAGDTFVSADGTFNASFNVSWTASADAFVDHYVVEWKKTSASDYFSQATKTSPLQIINLENSAQYNVRVKAVNELAVSSSYLTSTPTAAVDTTAPSAPTSASATGVFAQINLSWINPAQKDFSHVDVYRSDTSNGTYTLIGNTDGTTFQDGNLGNAATKFYKLKAVDFTGNASAFSSEVTSTTTQIPTGSIADNAIGTAQIADDAITIDQIANDAVSTAQIVDDAVTNALIATNAVDQGSIAANAVTATEIATDAVTANKILAGSITAGKIAADAVTATKISVDDLSAINADLGTITAGSIDGVTIKIGSGESVFKADTNGIYLGNETFANAEFRVSPAGAVTATSATISGDITATSGSLSSLAVSGALTVGTSGKITGGTSTSFNTGAGFFLGYDSSAYKFSIGDASTKKNLTWDGADIKIGGAQITAPDNPNVVIYDGQSGLPPSITSGRTTLENNTGTFYLKQDYKEHIKLHLTYPVGALTSGTVSGETNAINSTMAAFKFQVFYAPITDPTNFTQFGTDINAVRETSSSSLSGKYLVKTTDLGSGNFKAELQTKSQVQAADTSLSGFNLGVIDDKYNLTKTIIVYDFPAGEYVFKVSVTITDGTASSYPSTGSPANNLKRFVDAVGFQMVNKSGYTYALEPSYQPITIFRDDNSNEIVRLSEGADTLELSAINNLGIPVQAFIGGGSSSTTSWGARIQFDEDLNTYSNGSFGSYQIGIDKSGTHLSLGTAPSGGVGPNGLNPSLSEVRISSGRTDILGTLFLNGTQITGTGTISQAESYPVSQYYDVTLTTTSTTIGSFTLPAPDSAVSKRQELDISVLFEIQNAGQTAQALSSIDFIVEKKSKGVNAVTVGSLTVESAPHTNMQLISVSGNQLNKVDIAGGVAASADASNTNEPASINSVYYDTTADKTYILSEAASSIFATGNTLHYSDSKFASTGTWVQPSSTEVIDSITPPDPDINYVNATSVSSGTGKSRFYIPFKMSYGKTTTATDYRIKVSVSSIPTGITYKAVKMFGSLKNIA